MPAQPSPGPYPAYPRPPRVRPRVRRPDSPRPSMILMNNENQDEHSRLHYQDAQMLPGGRLPAEDEPEQLPPYEPAPPPYSPIHGNDD
ncbi:uncharacterized protein Aud_006716 [Aspergillus udagawae]|uniref:Uncharacterized protein n=1 Tax=Aspergillus udagawae TaxID=91492 RepID=A0A8E0UYA0_9EURO|nr:uncharacterized protein Aud_006716 [Aspergillus udagawae]GIC90282.1 hypothetical protein Aud_006716 [Aspergillus udagawae]